MPRERHAKEERTILERFQEYDTSNPEVYRLYRFYALQLYNSGVRKGGSKAIWERLRWEFLKKHAEGREAYKLPNDFTPYYARKLVEEDPRFADFFSFRATPAADRAEACVLAEQKLSEEGLGL